VSRRFSFSALGLPAAVFPAFGATPPCIVPLSDQYRDVAFFSRGDRTGICSRMLATRRAMGWCGSTHGIRSEVSRHRNGAHPYCDHRTIAFALGQKLPNQLVVRQRDRVEHRRSMDLPGFPKALERTSGEPKSPLVVEQWLSSGGNDRSMSTAFPPIVTTQWRRAIWSSSLADKRRCSTTNARICPNAAHPSFSCQRQHPTTERSFAIQNGDSG